MSRGSSSCRLSGVFDLQVELIKHVLVLIEIRPTMTTKNKAIGGGGKRYETSGQGTYRGFRQGVGRREIPQGVLSKIEEGFKVKAFEQRRKKRKITSCSEGIKRRMDRISNWPALMIGKIPDIKPTIWQDFLPCF